MTLRSLVILTIPVDLLPPVTYTNQADVLQSIQHERRVEFGFEFHRYFDVIRWGKLMPRRR